LRAATESEAELLVGQLVLVQARPLIRSIVKYKLRETYHPSAASGDSQDVEDVCSEAVLDLLLWLRKLRADQETNAIRNFRGFVAVLAYRACATYMRRKHPLRSSLKNRIHYSLSHQWDFAVWKGSDDEWICGLKIWMGRKAPESNSRLEVLRTNPRGIEELALAGCHIRQVAPDLLLRAIFDWLGTPLKLDDIIGAVAELWGIRDNPYDAYSDNDGVNDTNRRIPTNTIEVATGVEQRAYLERVWTEIGLLPIKQRCALLLNLTHSPGDGVLPLLPILGIASVCQIATALGMTDEGLAEIWNLLPLEDSVIADRLSVTRQQVINLRKAARQRLARRMKAAESDRKLVLKTASP
ncbi:MAG: hypothetical protein ACREDR_14145, partial [Blastocatellia bacterium]